MQLELLWSDIAFISIIVSLCVFIYILSKQYFFRQAVKFIFHRKIGIITFLILFSYFFIGILDSIHFTESNQYTISSLLDKALSPWATKYEKTYSAPFATHLYSKSVTINKNHAIKSSYIPLLYVNSINKIPQIIVKSIFFATTLYFLGIILILFYCYLRSYNLFNIKNIACWLFTIYCLMNVFIILSNLSANYHILGTDIVGQDVFYKATKSIRTGLIVGIFTTIITLPFAIFLGTIAGFYGGIIDDVIQYIYTTLNSIPSILLITSAVFLLQVYIKLHPNLFHSMALRADIRLLGLCCILGLSSWTNLCRLLRAETLKIKSLDFINAALSMKVNKLRIILRHIVPNIAHIILIVVIIDFSGLVLAEAILSYVGVGVDPTMLSWGNMINAARNELSREPIIWWTIFAAFIFMFILLLSANLFADLVKDAFDPKINH